MRATGRCFLALAVLNSVVSACGSQKKVGDLKREAVAPLLAISGDEMLPPEIPTIQQHSDSLTVTGPDGRELIIMNAVRNQEGEMVANDVIDAAVVTARFRNVAERNGKVNLCFDVVVPTSMVDSRWQLRLQPVMTVMGRRTELDAIAITGSSYRRTQLRGYQRYRRFLDSIVTDSTAFVRMHELEVFLKRNIPQVYKYRTDTTFVSEEEFLSSFGVSQCQAASHYTSKWRIKVNDRRVAGKVKAFEKYVKAPIVTEGIRLDTVMTAADGNVIYAYEQPLNVVAGMSRADISLCGGIFEQESCIYSIPDTEPVTFYISSLSSLADYGSKYLTRVVERRAEVNSVCWIDFGRGSSDVDTTLGFNAGEIARIKANLESLLSDDEFEVDSIIVTASCSPEGGFSYNEWLSRRRSESVAEYFRTLSSLPFVARSVPENWEMLSKSIAQDDSLSVPQKECLAAILTEAQPDKREELLSRTPEYRYLREKIYPRLRTVEFDFCLHRRGMQQDTLTTTILDTLYMSGLQAIRDRNYKEAVTLLGPYQDINTAIAYCSMDYNESALTVLNGLEPSDKVEYMLALVYSRNGDDASAVSHFLNACKLNPAFVHRGNLDPEISQLIYRYNLLNN